MVKNKKIVAVIRGVQPRMTEINFYANFKNISVRFIGNKSTGWIQESKIPKNVSFFNVKLKPAYLIDPVKIIFGKLQAHRWWSRIDRLEDYIKDVDVVNISDAFYFYSGQSAALAKKLNKKLVTIVWESIPNHPSTYIPPYSFNVRSVLKNTNLFIARSNMAKKYLLSIGADKNKIQVIYKGINQNRFYPQFNKKTNKIKILYVGQLVKCKGLEDLLEAFIKLSKEFSNLELVICARSSGENLEKKVKKLAKLYPIKFLGHIEYDNLPAIYRQCDIYCQLSQDVKYFGILPGWNEWFSYSIIEAMSSGLPIVATNVGGIPEQVGEKNILIDQKDPKQAYQALKELIVNKKKRIEIGKSNAQRAKDLFDIIKQAKKTEEAILKIL